MSLLGWLSLTAASLVVVVLAGYLLAILVELERARRNLARLADGLAAIEANAEPLDGHMEVVVGGLGGLLGSLRAVDEDLGTVAGALGLGETDSERKAG